MACRWGGSLELNLYQQKVGGHYFYVLSSFLYLVLLLVAVAVAVAAAAAAGAAAAAAAGVVVVVVVVVVSERRHFEPSSWVFLGENLVTLTNKTLQQIWGQTSLSLCVIPINWEPFFLNDQRYVFERTPYEAAQAVDMIFCTPRRCA